MIHVDLASGTRASFALPGIRGRPLGRGLVVAPDVMGLRPLFDDLVDRLSTQQEWAVCAVEPFPGMAEMPLEERLGHRLDAERLTTDLVLGADLVQQSGVDRVGIIGFCMGGMNAFRAAGTGRFDRAVAFYGMIRPPEQWSAPGNDPLDALARPECCPTLAIVGGNDKWTPPADIATLEAAGPHVITQLYADAEHGFVHDPSRPAHRPDDAADAWRRAIDFLRLS